ncbi:glycoside hydrolase family 2 TIM barrel-domain containing protein [Halalkalibacter sp. APA_J-10(15)]|uniref:glycoside hydrolase family 2 TIM barrel-domain containing protein n=1 Tax=Halalkalibacter sp. APA_J-10(15) TaxID=2933805 RepID=UPI001FF4C340|nr:glycoside hydrolase family 2 TIM barrel-domain containing protein [Halalkalibacter sp. APA_J-10(15)]MCK0469960.1 DUF4982 domain-containing protein [Halalkalibacter sp. APA_J-10(15)]
MNNQILFNDGWEFAKSRLDVTDDENLSYEPVDLPHDWLIYDTSNLYETSIGWYRKTFHCPKNRRMFLYFEGVYMDSSIYVNGQFVGEWKNGYSSFEYEITDALVDGENEIVVKVVFQAPNSRWYSGAGIYRNVWLKSRSDHYIESDGIYISTTEMEDGWKVEVETELNVANDVIVSHQLLYKGKVITTTCEQVLSATEINKQSLFVASPKLWSVNEPNLYELETTLSLAEVEQHSNLLEAVSLSVGFRTVQLDSQKGLFVNGEKVKINGVCEHHDLGALGAAFNKTALKRRLVILKEMGVNGIRTAHNMPAVELMDLADEMGFLVVSEAFDMWERPKTKYDYARFFKDWAYKDVRSWVRRDRNHPSLIMWSIGNEIYDTHADERGQEITRKLMEYVEQFDPKQNGYVTIGSNYMPWENAQKCADIVKVAGYNYAEKYYEKHHEEHPDWIIYGSETSSLVQSRGIYHFPFEQSILADDNEQCSSLGNSSTSWGAKSAEACIIAERDTPFSLGQFLWTGFDYIGEPTPYHTKNSYFGQIDTATFKKDAYYVYQAEWTDYKTSPMVHIFPYWDFNKGQIIDIRVCSNAPKIELQFNGETVGTHHIDHENGTDLVGWWKIPFEEGELKAIAYDEHDQVIATDIRRSFGEAKEIRLELDKKQLRANGTDLVFMEISMVDKDGNRVENANNRVDVMVSGAGRLVGLDNGDSTDYDQYKGTSRRLFSGKLMAIIAAKLEPGDVHIKVSSKEFKSEQITIKSIATDEDLVGVSAFMENERIPVVMGDADEVPLRKIEIVSDAGQQLDPNKKELTVTAILHPEHTSYQEVEWSAVADNGSESNIAKVESDGHRANVTALGDGEFRLRCTSKNGTGKTKLISQLEMKAVGLGTAYKDAYGFISAGLYDYSKGEVTNGNERGVATSRDGQTQVGFREIDFGESGSNTITIPIFALSSEEYPIQIWEGMPEEEGSSLVADVVYQKPSKWNVYQEETYKLNKKLKGITSLCFVLNQKVHIKGFSFEKQNRAFETNLALDAEHIYGDSFELKDQTVERIGNNVSLTYESIDFTTAGTSTITVYGRAPVDKNTIQIRFENDEGESSQMIEFDQSADYEEKTFDLEKVTGIQKVTFVFLPGCNFDFGWFKFNKSL